MWREHYVLVKGFDLAVALSDLQEAFVSLPDIPLRGDMFDHRSLEPLTHQGLIISVQYRCLFGRGGCAGCQNVRGAAIFPVPGPSIWERNGKVHEQQLILWG